MKKRILVLALLMSLPIHGMEKKTTDTESTDQFDATYENEEDVKILHRALAFIVIVYTTGAVYCVYRFFKK